MNKRTAESYAASEVTASTTAPTTGVGFVRDYITDAPVRATPEEVESVQIFAKRLVEDYGYSRGQIQTRPQFRVRKRPSDDERSYPVDIAVFGSDKKTEDQLYIVVECKKKLRKEGVAQLKLYLDMSPAELGVWFNGNEHVYLRKTHHKDGRRTYAEIPSIPRQGQRIEDIGRFRRKDLVTPSNLKAVFRDIRNHLAGHTTGITRDESLAQEIINLLFCKIYDEINTAPDDFVTVRSGVDEAAKDVRKRIVELFEDKVKPEYPDVFSAKDGISLDAESLVYVVGELQPYCVTAANRDAIGDAFEVFIGPALRGAEGQFFTPRNVVRMVVEILDPAPGELLIDPACGSGGFLIVALEHVWKRLEEEAKRKRWSDVQLDRKKRDLASKCFRGLDKDSFLAKVTKAYMAIIGDGRGGVFCEKSHVEPEQWHHSAQEVIKLGSFDVVITNPPFGAKIKITGAPVLSQYDLGHKWRKDKKAGLFERQPGLKQDSPPQILFLERCLQLLKPGGRLGIVLPESILGNPSYEYIVNYVLERTTVLGVVTMPEALFKTSGKGGTHTKVCVLFLQKQAPKGTFQIFMADAKWCGHDSRGNPTIRKLPSGEKVLLDEVPEVAERFRAFAKGDFSVQDHRGFLHRSDSLVNRILVPKYYDPEVKGRLDSLSKTHILVSIGSLVDRRALSVDTGIEIGKMAYGTGRIAFVRTSDFSNWEIKADFKHGVSEEIYERLKKRVDVKAGDILMVRDGTYLIGTTAIVTESDLPLLFQSHIYRLRVLDPKVIEPWLLFACLNAPVVKKQIRSKQFTQDIIDTLGRRLLEVVVPIPKDRDVARRIGEEVKVTVETRVALRNRTSALALEVEGTPALEAVSAAGEDE